MKWWREFVRLWKLEYGKPEALVIQNPNHTFTIPGGVHQVHISMVGAGRSGAGGGGVGGMALVGTVGQPAPPLNLDALQQYRMLLLIKQDKRYGWLDRATREEIDDYMKERE